MKDPRQPTVLSLLSRVLTLGLFAGALCASPAFAQEEDDDDDDILAPIEDEKPAATPDAPRKKFGFVPLVPVGNAGKPLAEQVTAALTKEFAESGVIEAVSLTVGSGDGAAEVDMAQGQDAATTGDKFRKRGQKYLKKLNFSKARRTFKRAVDAYMQAGAAMTDVSPIIEVYLGIAESYARQGKEEEADEALENAARLNPEYVLDDKLYPPLFIRTHAKARKRVLKETPGTLEVDGTAVGAEVRIDGRVVGTAPIRITNVPPGEHLVRVFKEKEGLFGSAVSVSEGATETVKPGFVELGATGPLDQLASNTFTAAAARTVAAEARKEKLVAAVVGVVGKTRAEVPTRLIVIDATSAQVNVLPVMRFDGDLLNMAIEGLKGREGIEQSVTTGGYGAVEETALIEGVDVGREVQTTEVAMRFDVKAIPADTGRSRTSRSALVTGIEDDGEEKRGRLIAGGDSKKRSRIGSVRDDKPAEGTFGQKKKFDDEAIKQDESILAQPWFLGTVAGAGAAVVVVGAGAAFGAYYFLAPPAGVRINVVTPGAE